MCERRARRSREKGQCIGFRLLVCYNACFVKFGDCRCEFDANANDLSCFRNEAVPFSETCSSKSDLEGLAPSYTLSRDYCHPSRCVLVFHVADRFQADVLIHKMGRSKVRS